MAQMRLSVVLSFIIFSSIGANAQNAYVKLGQQALINGDFKTAVHQLERACFVDSTNAYAFLMLGYSYYHSENYRKSVTAYSKVISIKPTDADAYYWRSRAKSYLARDITIPAEEKEKNLLGAIHDLTTALTLAPIETRFYQVRGIAYREYGVFKLQNTSKLYDRQRGISALKASISDLNKVLAENPGRDDIATQISLSKEKLYSVQQGRN